MKGAMLTGCLSAKRAVGARVCAFRLLERWTSARYAGQLAALGTGAVLDRGITIVMGVPAGHKGIAIGDRTRIYAGNRLVTDVRSSDSGIQIGSDCAINYDCYIVGNGGVTIGDDVIIGAGVQILSAGHGFRQHDPAIRLQSTSEAPIAIRDDVWIGGGAIILQGVTIGPHSVVGAGAVVTDDVPPHSVAMGVPARSVPTAPPDILAND
jgi:acetyltransferase-like isoleucine patch superfamily enzyme